MHHVTSYIYYTYKYNTIQYKQINTRFNTYINMKQYILYDI